MYFSVLVAVPCLRDLDVVLGRLDRATRVEPHRVYIEPETRRLALEKTGESDVVAALSRYLGEPVEVELVDDIPVYFTMSQDNREGRFAGWRIGGRFTHRFKPRDQGHRDLLRPEQPREDLPGFRRSWVDGGPVHALDLEGTRQSWVDAVASQWDAYDEARRRHPAASSWSAFFRRINAGTYGSLTFLRDPDADPAIEDYTMEQASRDYRAQPLIAEWERIDADPLSGCPIDRFGDDRATHLRQIRGTAISCHALVTLDGDWLEADPSDEFRVDGGRSPGEVAHDHLVNNYVDALPDDAWLAVVEVHN